MARHPERNDRRSGPSKPYDPGKRDHARGPRRPAHEGAGEWVWGWHAALAALGNPARPPVKRILATADRAKQLAAKTDRAAEVMEAAGIAQLLPPGAVHQGLAIRVGPPEPISLDELASPADGFLLILDQVTDPQNVGAIFRSAAALGARGVILQDRHAPPLAGALAKAAAGAIDALPHARVTNLSRALEELDDLGWRAVGLDGGASESLDAVLDARPTVLVLGSEGEGLRRLVAEHCDVLARIPMASGFESLNVSAAAAVALYEAARKRR